MNSNWTGRAPRTLDACTFREDCGAIEHYKTGDRGAWVMLVVVVAALTVAMAVHFVVRLV